jgi:LacI family transcriptional regulator
MGYQPHPVAHRLATGRTGAIALVLSVRPGNTADATFAALLSGASEALRPQGYFALSVALPAGDEEMPELARFLAGRLVDGVILARTRIHDPRVTLLQQQGVHFVTHGRTQHNAAHAWVDTDNERAFYIAAQRLIGLGHRRIAFINGDATMMYAWLRTQGFQRALAEAGLDAAQCPVRHGDVTAASGDAIASELLAHSAAAGAPITALLCATDAIAIGAMHAVRRAGLVVGRDVSVIGYGNTYAGQYAEPPLTTIDHATVDNGRHLADMLLRKMAGEPPQSLARLEPVNLIARQTDGPPIPR